MAYVVGLAIYHSLRSCHCVNLEYNTGPQPAHEKTNNGNKWQIELDVDINIRFSDISMSDLTRSGINLWWPDFTMIDKFAKALVNCRVTLQAQLQNVKRKMNSAAIQDTPMVLSLRVEVRGLFQCWFYKQIKIELMSGKF